MSLQALTATLSSSVTIYRVLDQPVYLVYESRPFARPGPSRLSFDGELARLLFTHLADTGFLRSFYGANRLRCPGRGWIQVSKGNLAELLSHANVVLAVGPGPLPETGLPALTNTIQQCECPVTQAHMYIGLLQGMGLLVPGPPSLDWAAAFCAESACIPEARGVLSHPIFPDGDAEGWLDERPSGLPPPDPALPHLRRLFSAVPMDDASRAVLYSYLFAAFHKCSLSCPRPLLFVDSMEQQVGKSVTGEAIPTLVDTEPRTLSLDRGSNEGEEVVAQLAHGNRCLVLPNLAARRNWNNTLIATLCTDIGQSRRLKYAARSTTFYGTLGITSAVLGAVTLHRDLVSRIWRVALSGRPAPSLEVVPQRYAAANREALQAEILEAHARSHPYSGRVRTRFPEFEAAGAAAYAAFAELSHDEVSSLLERAERARHFLRDEVMASLYAYRPEVFRERLPWSGVGEGRDWLRAYDGAHGFGFILSDGQWKEIS